MMTNYNDQKKITAKENNSENTGKSLTNKDDVGKNEYPGKTLPKDIAKNDPGSKNEQLKKGSSIFRL